MSRLLLASLALLPGCPVFTEFLPDPQASSDVLGEYLEIAWEGASASWDTLRVQFEDNTPQIWSRPESAGHRLLLHRNAPLSCPAWNGLYCNLLTTPAMPNSRSVRWTLAAGICRDTADLPLPGPGTALQRSGPAPGAWSNSLRKAPPEKTGTPGLPDPDFETGLDDCVSWVRSAQWSEGAWRITLEAKGCEERTVHVSARFLDGTPEMSWDLALTKSSYALPALSGQSNLWLRRVTPMDDNPANDTLDTLLVLPAAPPLRITEAAPCPEEPWPEWFEITNETAIPFPLASLSDCNGHVIQTDTDSLPPGTPLLLGRDSAALRTWLGYSDVRIAQIAISALRNGGDTLRLCWKNILLDSMVWGAKTGVAPDCPHTLTPANATLGASPGYIVRIPSSSPHVLETNVRILSRSNPQATLQARWRADAPGLLLLLGPDGKQLDQQRTAPSPVSGPWTPIFSWRRCPPGPCFLRFTTEDGHESTLGFVVCP
jgi:hypothetical protein